MIILEEASRLDTDVFFEVVVPLLGVANTALLGISTPMGEDDYYSQLTKLSDENERPLFKSLSIELCCPACRAKDATATQCVHRIDMLPEWKSEGRHEKVKRIMASVPELYMREALGVVASEKFGVFTSGQTNKLAASLSGMSGTEEKMGAKFNGFPVFVVVDPTGGGSSKLALISMCVFRFLLIFLFL
mgnify:CR=1 FL=1